MIPKPLKTAPATGESDISPSARNLFHQFHFAVILVLVSLLLLRLYVRPASLFPYSESLHRSRAYISTISVSLSLSLFIYIYIYPSLSLSS